MTNSNKNSLNSAKSDSRPYTGIQHNPRKNSLLKHLSPADILVFCFWSLTAVCLFVFQGSVFSENADTVVIRTDEATYYYPLFSNEKIELESMGYSITVLIDEGCVSVSDASCPDHLCISTGKIRRAGETIVCLPAGVSVSLTNPSKGTALPADGIAG